jgi:hypothetical protein
MLLRAGGTAGFCFVRWEQFLLSRAQPLLPGIGLAFWAVTIPA